MGRYGFMMAWETQLLGWPQSTWRHWSKGVSSPMIMDRNAMGRSLDPHKTQPQVSFEYEAAIGGFHSNQMVGALTWLPLEQVPD